MDCRDTELALSALHDGALTAPEEVAAVRDHCATCASCSRFADALRALDAVPAPTAPPALADRLVAAVAAEAEALAGAAHEAEAKAAAGIAAVGTAAAPPIQARLAADAKAPAWLTRSRLWAITGGVAASAAVLVMAVVLTQNLTMRSALDQAAEQSPTRPTLGLSGSAAPTTVPSQPPAGPVEAPDYVVFGGGVFVAGPSVDATGSTLTTVGVVLTSLDLGGTPMPLTALRSAPGALAIVLRLPNAAYRRFDPVTRVYGTRTYQLQSGTAITRFGEWPRLVPSVPEPTGLDGSPSMRKFALDSAGVPVYVRIGANPDTGFAIAPKTLTTDPAAGNPFWTWWAPQK